MRKINSEEYPFIKEEIDTFYTELEKYQKDTSFSNELMVDDALRSLYFSLKGYKVLGYINQSQFEEIIDCCNGEINND